MMRRSDDRGRWSVYMAAHAAALAAGDDKLTADRKATAARREALDQRAREIAADKELRKARELHCQICERGILADTGVIAHHGYERPGQGWQTSSCMGARALPYEADREVLGIYVDALHVEHMNLIEAAASCLREEWTFYIEWQTGRGHDQQKHRAEVTRATFDAVVAANPDWQKGSYQKPTFDKVKEWELNGILSRRQSVRDEHARAAHRWFEWPGATRRWTGDKWEIGGTE